MPAVTNDGLVVYDVRDILQLQPASIHRELADIVEDPNHARVIASYRLWLSSTRPSETFRFALSNRRNSDSTSTRCRLDVIQTQVNIDFRRCAPYNSTSATPGMRSIGFLTFASRRS